MLPFPLYPESDRQPFHSHMSLRAKSEVTPGSLLPDSGEFHEPWVLTIVRRAESARH